MKVLDVMFVVAMMTFGVFVMMESQSNSALNDFMRGLFLLSGFGLYMVGYFSIPEQGK